MTTPRFSQAPVEQQPQSQEGLVSSEALHENACCSKTKKEKTTSKSKRKKKNNAETSAVGQPSEASSVPVPDAQSFKEAHPEMILKEMSTIKTALAHPSSSHIEQPATDSAQNIRKESCLYCTPLGPLAGILTISQVSLTFEPDPRCAEVIDHGIGRFQVFLDIADVVECAAVMIPDGPFLTQYFGFPAHQRDADDDQEAPVPGFFQILLRLRNDDIYAHEKAFFKKLTKLNSSESRITYHSLDSSKDKDKSQKLDRTKISAEASKSGRKLLSNEFIEDAKHEDFADSPPSEEAGGRNLTMLLFRFTEHLEAKNLTRFLIDVIDKRAKSGHGQMLPSSLEQEIRFQTPVRATSANTLVNQNTTSDLPGPHLTLSSLSSIPFASNRIFETALLSPTSQQRVVDRLINEHSSHPDKTPGEHQISSSPDSPFLQNPTEGTYSLASHQYSGFSAKDGMHWSGRRSHRGSHAIYRPRVWDPIIKQSSCDLSRGPCLLTYETACELCTAVPVILASKAFDLKFCTQRYGLSYKTFYRQLLNAGPCIFLILDTENCLFGGFCPTSIRESSRYYGTGETFVFTFKSIKSPSLFSVNDKEQAQPPCRKISVFPWSKRNQYYVLTTNSTIVFGGGDSSAITVDSNFLRGSSEYCDTFRNEPLASSPDFVIQYFQVWSFSDP